MAGGIVSPERNAKDQQVWNQQVSMSYFLDVDWTIPKEFQEVRQLEGNLKELRKAAKEGVLSSLIGDPAELRTKANLAEARARKARAEISQFRVLPQYRELEAEASRLTVELANLVDEAAADQNLIEQIEDALKAERIPTFADVDQVYRQAGVVLGDAVVKRFEEVQRFHESVVENRRSHLSTELQASDPARRQAGSQKGRDR